jgi:hypothetical protein
MTWKEFKTNVEEALRMHGTDPDTTDITLMHIDVEGGVEHCVKIHRYSGDELVLAVEPV